MKLGTEDKKKVRLAAVAGTFGLIALGVLYNELFGGPSSPPPPPAAVVTSAPPQRSTPSPQATSASPGFTTGIPGRGARKVGTAGTELDPTLHPAAMLRTESIVYTGSGRNIFGAGSAPPPKTLAAVVQPRFPPRPNPVPVPVPIASEGPPPPPPINLKFFGTATYTGGTRRALLLNGDDVYLASAGEVVQRRYRIITVNPNSVVVEDLPNNNRQTLPLLGN